MVKVRLPEHILSLAEDYTERLTSALEMNRVVVLDIETDGLEGNNVWVVGVLSVCPHPRAQPDMITIEQARKILPKYVEQGYFFVIHNAKFDLRVLAQHGIHLPPSQVLDTMLLSYVADPSREGGHSLANLGPKMDYRESLIKAQLLDPKAPKHAEYLVPLNPVMLQYCATDLEVTRDLFNDLVPTMMEKDYAAWCLFAGIEMQFLPIVMEMERTGLHLDIERARVLVALWYEQRYRLAQKAQSIAGFVPGKEKTYKKGYHKSNGVTTYNHTPLLLFNPASNDHIAYVLKRMGWKPTKFTTTGKPQTDLHVLNELRGKFELVDLLLEISHLDKLTSMVESYIEKAEESGGWVRGEFNQALTRTGRLSSSNPNLQNIPGRGKDGELIRSLFTAPPGTQLIRADLSNIEARVLAHFLAYFEGDTGLADTFARGEDFHQYNADTWKVDRTTAKTLLFACVPETTMILTKRGWLTHDEVQPGDYTVGYNFETGENEWTEITHVHHYDEAPLMRFSTSRRVMTATPNHKWITDRGYRQSRRAKRMFVREFTEMQDINSEHRIINTAVCEDGPGLTLDALVHKTERDGDWFDLVVNMTQSERWLWFSANIATDGSMSGTSPVFSQCVKQIGLTDAMHLCGYLLGYNVARSRKQPTYGDSYEIDTLRFTVKPHTGMQTAKVEHLPPAPVWCVTTRLGSWTMREGDFISCTSNSLYGAGAEKVGGGDKEHGQKLLDTLDRNMPSIMRLKTRVWDNTRKHPKGVIHTWFGRRLVYPDIKKGGALEARAKRQVFNAMLQGTSADILKMIAITVQREVHSRPDLRDCAMLCAQVHDEGVWIVFDDDVNKFLELVDKAFAFDYLECVPIKGEALAGPNWNDAHS